MKRKWFIAAAVAASAVVSMPTVAGATSKPTPTPPAPVTVVSGLHNPRQIAVGPFGILAVAEAGSGNVGGTIHDIPCGVGPEGPSCIGNSGSITGILGAGSNHPLSARLFNGLMSAAAPNGTNAVGMDALSFGPTGLAGIFTKIPGVPLPQPLASQNGQLVKFTLHGVQPIANIGDYSLANPLPGHGPDSDPYGVLSTGGVHYVADAANNTLLKVKNGHISVVATFRHGSDQGGLDGVPTSIAEHNGYLYVGELGSLAPGQGQITVLKPNGTVVKTITGLTSVTSIAVAPNGDIYATELFTGAPFVTSGALVKIPANGGPRVTTTLSAPGGVAVVGGKVYVSINSISPTDGAIVRLPA
jgi:hypothetical protein